MDLININKYESIADRIKRLGQQNQQATTTPTFQKMYSPRSPTPTSYNHYQKKQQTETYKPNYFQKKLISRIATQDTEHTANQQSYTIIDDIRSYRETQYNPNYGQERTTIGYPTEEPSLLEEIKQENIVKQETLKHDLAPRSRILSKVKSENSLKIDEILQSYNSYKQNKEQFISQIKNNSQPTHYRAVSQSIKKPEVQYQSQPQDISFERKCKKTGLLNSIDNLWNASQSEQAQRTNPLQFEIKERSRAEDILMRVTSLRKQQTNRNNENDANGPRYNSKFILKNLVTQPVPREQHPPKLGMALSPRGLRVPGKICKNHDKSMATLRKYES